MDDVVVEHVVLVHHPMRSAHVAMVGREDDEGVIGRPGLVEGAQDAADRVVDLRDHTEISGDHLRPLGPRPVLDAPARQLLPLDVGLPCEGLVEARPGCDLVRLVACGELGDRPARQVRLHKVEAHVPGAGSA